MDLSTRYMGFNLRSPLIIGASPMVDDLSTVKRLEDAGASAVVMHSLFEEQLVREQVATFSFVDGPAESFAEATTYFPAPEHFVLGPDDYLNQIRKIHEQMDIPVIGSLNGMTPGGWLNYARQIEQAGADGLELNVYFLATDPNEMSETIEIQTIEMLQLVKNAVHIPVAVKLSPFYTSFANMAQSLAQAGADALVMFNRFYQPDIDLENLEVQRRLKLSDPSELLLRLRWLAILSGRIRTSLAASGGVHSGTDAIKAVMCGADVVQMVSVLLQHGPEYINTIEKEMARWLELHDYASLNELKGAMSLRRCPDPKNYERANYVELLKSWTSSEQMGINL
jgi:dihydroorotate dehydrogenase (fumarate)